METTLPFSARMGRGSPLSAELRERIVCQLKNNVSQRRIAKNLGLSPSTVNKIVKRFKETGEISVRKGQGRKPLLNVRELRALWRYCIRNRHSTVMDITTWARDYFKKTLSVNTVRRCIKKFSLRLYQAKKKPCFSFVQKRVFRARAYLGLTKRQWKRDLWSDDSARHLIFGKSGRRIPRATVENRAFGPFLMKGAKARINYALGAHQLPWHGPAYV